MTNRGAGHCQPHPNYDKDSLLDSHQSLRMPSVATSDCVGVEVESPPRTAFLRIRVERGTHYEHVMLAVGVDERRWVGAAWWATCSLTWR